MKKVISMFALVAILITTVFIGCKKGVDNEQNVQVSEKFFKTTAQTKPIVKKLVQYLQETNKLGNLENYVKKHGYPNWDKSIVKKKSNAAARDMTEEEYVAVPTVDETVDVLEGFIAASISSTGVVVTSYLGSSYKDFPYENLNQSGVKAEDVVNAMLNLEKEVYGVENFKITDAMLSFFQAAQNGDVPLLTIKDGDKTGDATLNSGYIYTANIKIIAGQLTQLTSWTQFDFNLQSLANLGGDNGSTTGDNGFSEVQVEKIPSGYNFLSEQDYQIKLNAISASAKEKYGRFACTPDRRHFGTRCNPQLNGKCGSSKPCVAVTQLLVDTGDDFGDDGFAARHSKTEIKEIIDLIESSYSIKYIYDLN